MKILVRSSSCGAPTRSQTPGSVGMDTDGRNQASVTLVSQPPRPHVTVLHRVVTVKNLALKTSLSFLVSNARETDPKSVWPDPPQVHRSVKFTTIERS